MSHTDTVTCKQQQFPELDGVWAEKRKTALPCRDWDLQKQLSWVTLKTLTACFEGLGSGCVTSLPDRLFVTLLQIFSKDDLVLFCKVELEKSAFSLPVSKILCN